MPMQRSQLDREPSLTEMIADPIVQAIMAGDGVTKAEMEGLIGAARGQLAGRTSVARKTGREVTRPD